MKRKIYIRTALLSLFAAFFLACSEATIQEDAMKAAELTTQSNKYSMDSDFKNAGNAYKQAQELMEKYKKLDKFDEFYQLYISYLQDKAYIMDSESSIIPE